MSGSDREAYGRAGASAQRKFRQYRSEHWQRQRRAIAVTAPFSAAGASVLGWITADAADAARPGIVIGSAAFAFGIGVFLARTPEASTWGKGARGERKTGRKLDRLPGWSALHDRAVPGSRANLDHVLIGPGGVLYVDTKNWTSRTVEIRRGTLWYGGDKTGALKTVLWEAGHVSRALGTPVRPVVSFHGQSQLRITELDVDGQTVTVLPSDVLTLWIKNLPALLGAGAAEDLARRADRALPPHTA